MQQLLVKLAADGLLIAILFIGGAVTLWYAWKHKHSIVRTPSIIMAGLTSLFVGKLMSLIYQPSTARPYIEQGVAAGAAYINNPGFPSDHALLATVVVLIVAMCTPYKKIAFGLALMTVIMSIARVMALVHTPLDVVGGVVAGCIGAYWYVRSR